jgi:hypothetical protein
MRGGASAIVAPNNAINPEFAIAADDCKAARASRRRGQKCYFSRAKRRFSSCLGSLVTQRS